MIEEASAELLKNKGAVVNISSVAALIPSSNWGIYGVVKAAQDKLTTNLAFSVWAVLTRMHVRLCLWSGLFLVKLCGVLLEAAAQESIISILLW